MIERIKDESNLKAFNDEQCAALAVLSQLYESVSAVDANTLLSKIAFAISGLKVQVVMPIGEVSRGTPLGPDYISPQSTDFLKIILPGFSTEDILQLQMSAHTPGDDRVEKILGLMRDLSPEKGGIRLDTRMQRIKMLIEGIDLGAIAVKQNISRATLVGNFQAFAKILSEHEKYIRTFYRVLYSATYKSSLTEKENQTMSENKVVATLASDEQEPVDTLATLPVQLGKGSKETDQVEEDPSIRIPHPWTSGPPPVLPSVRIPHPWVQDKEHSIVMPSVRIPHPWLPPVQQIKSISEAPTSEQPKSVVAPVKRVTVATQPTKTVRKRSTRPTNVEQKVDAQKPTRTKHEPKTVTSDVPHIESKRPATTPAWMRETVPTWRIMCDSVRQIAIEIPTFSMSENVDAAKLTADDLQAAWRDFISPTADVDSESGVQILVAESIRTKLIEMFEAKTIRRNRPLTEELGQFITDPDLQLDTMELIMARKLFGLPRSTDSDQTFGSPEPVYNIIEFYRSQERSYQGLPPGKVETALYSALEKIVATLPHHAPEM